MVSPAVNVSPAQPAQAPQDELSPPARRTLRLRIGLSGTTTACGGPWRCRQVERVHRRGFMELDGARDAEVVRYTALASGIVYGIVHRKTLQERFDKSAAEKEVQQRAHWLEEAKKAWEAQKLQGKSGVVTDPEAPNFDLEALLKSYEK
ncbi:hypothetical protein RTG_00245 [Rhodotorula toruloides ATCC 204091]|uniref:ATP synthase F(0) complex subunit e, mitochondrial n=1 Tax=Rhodotorula toruloides TaxID=5286 RepID=A0A2T0A539_RHOTO|nr:hypothetical protein RTG_00245 [Rhodotorula toruloides ATCC 204091]PRQ73127.1 hypothetical protein AAT19DRAFT_15880 [Rhodotorula toruloides]